MNIGKYKNLVAGISALLVAYVFLNIWALIIPENGPRILSFYPELELTKLSYQYLAVVAFTSLSAVLTIISAFNNRLEVMSFISSLLLLISLMYGVWLMATTFYVVI